MKMQDRKWWTK